MYRTHVRLRTGHPRHTTSYYEQYCQVVLYPRADARGAYGHMEPCTDAATVQGQWAERAIQAPLTRYQTSISVAPQLYLLPQASLCAPA